MQTDLYGKIKERIGEWLIGAKMYTKCTLPFNCSNTRQDKGA